MTCFVSRTRRTASRLRPRSCARSEYKIFCCLEIASINSWDGGLLLDAVAGFVGLISCRSFWHSLCAFALIWRTGSKEGSVTMSRTVMVVVSAMVTSDGFPDSLYGDVQYHR